MDNEKKELMEEIISRVIKKLEEMGELNKEEKPSSHTVVEVKDEKKCSSCSTIVEKKETPTSRGEEVYNKRLLSEKDMIEYNKAEKKRIVYSKRTIVTDMAREYAKKFKIELIEEYLAK